MTAGFISDIHSNAEALEAVLAELRVDQLYCLGDIVGYGASPNQVVERLRKVGAVSIQGNHDRAVVSGDVSGFNARAAMAAVWTRKALKRDNADFLAALPTNRRISLGGSPAYLTHGSPDDNLWEYVHPATHELLFGHYLKKLHASVVAVGHLHVPFVWRGDEGVVFNPGSVGQPRDGDPRASYAVVTAEGKKLEVEEFRVEYDYRASARKIVKAGLPERLATRLGQGT